MVKKIFASVILFICLLSNAVFAYKWIQYGNDWYVLNETTNQFITSLLFDSGTGVYYLKEDGKMVTGWWKDPNNGKYYFFDNRQGSSYGAMVFGLRMIDGFYFFFNQDGSLATSDKLYELKKVYNEYYADYDGYLYSDNHIMRDTSLQKSELYSNPMYYNDPNMDNLTISKIVKPSKTDSAFLNNKSQVINNTNAKDEEHTDNPYNISTGVSGGTNYYIDENGILRMDYQPPKISDFEIYGPAHENY